MKNWKFVSLIIVVSLIIIAIAILTLPGNKIVSDDFGNEVKLGPESGKSSGDIATDFTLQTYDDKIVTLSEINKDRPVVVQFWATWCEICRHEFPENNVVISKYQDKVAYIAVDWNQSDKAAVKKYISELGLDPTLITFVMDTDGSVGSAYRVFGSPVYVFIKKGGEVSFKNTGGIGKENFENELKKII